MPQLVKVGYLMRGQSFASALGGDSSLTLDQNFLLNSASTMAMAAVLGPTLTKTIAGNAMSFDSVSNLAYAPHQLLENANWSDQTAPPDPMPSGWADVGGDQGTRTFEDKGDFFEATFTGVMQRPGINNNVTVVADTVYTAFFYLVSSTNTAGNDKIFFVKNTGVGGVNGTISQFDVNGFGSFPMWVAVGFKTTNSTTVNFRVGVGVEGNATGTAVISRPGVVKGLLPGVGLDVPAKLSGPPLGRWIGTDAGDEPLYDQPRFAHDPADSNAQLGLLEEPVAATQLCLQTSNQSLTWVAINTDVPSSTEVDVFGTDLGQEIAATSTADQQFARHQSFTGLTANVNTTVAWHGKPGTNANFVQLVWDSNGGGTDGCFCNFNLSTGAKGTVTALAAGTATLATIKLTKDGLYRCTVTGKIAVGTVGRFTINIIDRIDAGIFEAADLADNDSLIGGAADTVVGYPRTHIPATTAQVTQAKDIRTTTVLDWLNANAGTLFKQGIIPYVDEVERTLWSIDDGTATDRLRLYLDAAENGNFETVNSGDTDGASDGAAVIAVDTVFKLAGTYEDDSVIGYVDGTASAEDTAAGIPVTDAATVARFGDDSAAGTPANMITQVEKYFNGVKDAAFVSAL